VIIFNTVGHTFFNKGNKTLKKKWKYTMSLELLLNKIQKRNILQIIVLFRHRRKKKTFYNVYK